MHFSGHLLPTPAENLALEEAWLEMAEDGQWGHEILRLWQPADGFVVIGRGSRAAEEVNLPAIEAAGVPMLRRSSGGAAIVAGTGCLMYAVLLSYEKRPYLRGIDQAHRLVMERLLAALVPLAPQLQWQGTCDLVIPGQDGRMRKVSGNSLRCRRNWLLYHGTILLAMDLESVQQFLLHPPREPEYRQSRSHADFVANLHLPLPAVTAGLISAWQADTQSQAPLPLPLVAQLVAQRFGNRDWNFQR